MAESTTLMDVKVNQCRQNALLKSQRKRQAVFDAIAVLQQQGIPITKRAITKQANVSYPFLAKHVDLLQAIEDASGSQELRSLENVPESRSTDIALAAMKRQMEILKQQVKEKDAEIRRKQGEIDQLYGKLASRSELTDAEIRRKLAEALNQLQAYKDKEHP
jgi:hypothetical protein